MKTKKIILLTCCFLLVLTGMRLLWLLHHYPGDHPRAENGVVDLRGYDFSGETLQLNGEWMLYPWDLINPENLSGIQPEKTTIPGKWQDILTQSDEDNQAPFLYGTYRLRILLDGEEKREPFSMYVNDIRSASRVFINGKNVMEQGTVAITKSKHTPDIKPFYLTIGSDLKEIDLVIQVADRGGSKISGIRSPIQFGYLSSVERSSTISMLSQTLSSSILMLHLLFAIIIFVGFSRRIELLYLAIVFGSAAFSILLDDDKLLYTVFPTMSFQMWTMFLYISYVTTVVFLMLFLKRMLVATLENQRVLTIGYLSLAASYILYIILLIFGMRELSGILFAFIMMAGPLLIAISLFLIVWKGTPGVIYLLFAAICIISNIAWATLKSNSIIILPYYPFDLIIAVLCFAVFWFKHFFNITEESRTLASKLQKVNEKKDEFLANTSHELRNPLHGIMSISQTIYNTEPQLSEDNKRNMETLIDVSKRMSYILNDLLDAQRLKEGGIKLHMKDTDLSAVATGVVDTLRFMTKGKDLSFRIEIADNFPCVRADENRLYQILFNLVHNAVKFTEQGDIVIAAKRAGEMIEIHVKDMGIGMDEEAIETIFQPYDQGDSSMTAMGGGLGLGLSISKQLVRLHGGKLTVTSKLSEGSTFIFTVPKGEEQVRSVTEVTSDRYNPFGHSELPATQNGGNRPRVLAVDDDPLNVLIIKQILELNGFDVTTCMSGLEVMKLLNSGPWDLVLTDVMMPKMSGYELTQKIRERFTSAELPILLLTARSNPEDIQTGFQCGANDYITKPVDRAELVARVKALTDLRKSLAEQIAMEAALLQAQIRPHFLFNTLNAIAALSDENPRKMMELLNQFGNYLNASFTTQNLGDLVPLEKELHLVKSYVYIEQQRFGERLHVEWNIRVRSKVMVPPIAIQTIVENAINHGVLLLPDGGTVRITIEEKEDTAVVSIMDDGAGIESERVWSLLEEKDEASRGIGLLNTDKRLKRLFGTGLTITSELGVGTTVTFTIPL